MLLKTTIVQRYKHISVFFTDNSLTQKAYLNALASTTDYIARFIVSFIITPLIVLSLGGYFFGVWQILTRLVGYLSPASGKPALALRWVIANQQASQDYEEKRKQVGASLIVWILFLPFIMIIGAFFAWNVPYWIKAPQEIFLQIRLVTVVLVSNLALSGLYYLPESVLQGENLGYKRLGLAILFIFLGGAISWFFLNLGFKMVGLTLSILISNLLTGLMYLFAVKKYIPWFGFSWPTYKLFKSFLNLSLGFMFWSLIVTVMTNSDVLILGFFNSVVSVTSYTLTKYVPETLVIVIITIISAIIPGLGKYVGSGEQQRPTAVRSELLSLSWFVLTLVSCLILIWNRLFIWLWTGKDYFSGELQNVLILTVAMQFAFIQIDSNLIDLTLQINKRVLLGAISATLTIFFAIYFIRFLDLGIVGVLLGTLIGRLLLTLAYPLLVCKYWNISFLNILKGLIRPGLTTLLFFVIGCLINRFIPIYEFGGASGWFYFMFLVTISAGLFMLPIFFVGLTLDKRKKIYMRFWSIANSR